MVHFITEKRIELYEWYCEGVSQRKNVPGAKRPNRLGALLLSRFDRCELGSDAVFFVAAFSVPFYVFYDRCRDIATSHLLYTKTWARVNF